MSLLSLWGMPQLFPQGVSIPWAPAVYLWHTPGSGFSQQGSAHCAIRPGDLCWGSRGRCPLCGAKVPQGGSVWSLRGRAGLQGQILRLLFLDSKFNQAVTSSEPLCPLFQYRSSFQLVYNFFLSWCFRLLMLTTLISPSMAAMRPRPTGWGNVVPELWLWDNQWLLICKEKTAL